MVSEGGSITRRETLMANLRASKHKPQHMMCYAGRSSSLTGTSPPILADHIMWSWLHFAIGNIHPIKHIIGDAKTSALRFYRDFNLIRDEAPRSPVCDFESPTLVICSLDLGAVRFAIPAPYTESHGLDRRQNPDLPFLGVLVFYNQGNSLVFRLFSAVFLCFSRVFWGVETAKKSLVFRVVFLGFYLNTKEWKIRE